MNFILSKVLEFVAGKAIANSDRIRIAIYGLISAALVQIVGACQVCGAILTPPVVNAISLYIAGAAVTLILSLTHRDIAAPGETVDGAAVEIPEPPK